MEPASGIEPPTYGLRNRCSTTELRRLWRENVAFRRDTAKWSWYFLEWAMSTATLRIQKQVSSIHRGLRRVSAFEQGRCSNRTGGKETRRFPKNLNN